MKIKILLIAASALACATAPAAAAVMPFGVQTNVLKSTVTNDWGWSQCFQSDYGANGPSVATVLAGCNGNYLMMAASSSDGSLNFTLLAAAAKSDVTFNTGTGNVTHNANGVEWYFSDSYSWGFAPGGASVQRNSCDIVDSSFGTNGGDGTTGDKRLCWHTGGSQLNGGWRAGTADGLFNTGGGYQRYLFVADSLDTDVPEPAMLGLFGLGALGLGLARHRKA